MSEQPQTPETYAWVSKSGMIHTQPKCMNFVTLDKIDQSGDAVKRAKSGAMKIELADAFTRVNKGEQHCGMCVKIAAEAAKKDAPAESVQEQPKKQPARKTAPKQSPVKKAAAAKVEAKPQPQPQAETTEVKPKTRKVEGKANGTNAFSLFEAFAKADEEGKLPTGALTAYRLKVRAVLTAVGADLEKVDLTKIDVAATLAEFERNRPGLNPSTVRSYKDAFKRAVRLFCAYVANPETWDPTAPAERAPRVSGGPNPTKSQVRKWALEQGKIKEGELGPNYVPVALINAYKEAHASA